MRIASFLLTLFVLVAVASCIEPISVDDPDPIVRSALLIVGDPSALLESESKLVDRLASLGFEVRIVDDSVVAQQDADASSIVIMSKTVNSNEVGTSVKRTTAGVIFWEDNQQMLSMMATIDNDGSQGTYWHGTSSDVYVRSDAPEELRAGRSGLIPFYTRADQLTFSPPGELSSDAILIARFNDASNPRYAIYAYESGSTLADGTIAQGRRVYFGLYDDTFRYLTGDGLALFDGAVGWASADCGECEQSASTYCGDGVVQEPNDDGSYESCDEGAGNGNLCSAGDTGCTYCSTTCELVQVDPSDGVYSDPITITSGGTYTGSWESTNPDVPAVRISTSEPVVIEGASIRTNGAHFVKVDRGYGADVTVRDTRGYAVQPRPLGAYAGRFLQAETYERIIVENSYLEGTGGIYMLDSEPGAVVRIMRNRARNIDGRFSDGAGGYDGQRYVQFVQFDKGNAVDVEIAYNEVINEPYESRVEDVISLYNTYATSDTPVRIHNNFIRGAYPADPATDSFSGGGIMLGDGTGRNEYLYAYDNQVVATSNYGIAISAGSHSRIENNRIVSCGYANGPDGEFFVASQNVGVYIWNMHGSTSYSDNAGSGNVIGWMTEPAQRNDWWVPDASSWSSTRFASGPVPCSAEDAEYDRWLAKLDAASIVIGPAT